MTVDKEWIVDGVTYREGSQPDGLDATLTLSGPGGAPLTEQSWASPRGGYDPAKRSSSTRRRRSPTRPVCSTTPA
ncbi:hypothetical protein GS884_21375 [Rhodococcus hoagii]|nr:hypothetical protein [Prescottella equi]